MNKALKAYLAQSETLELDPAVLEEHVRAMNERVIPRIVEDIREGERMAAELRYSPAAAINRAK